LLIWRENRGVVIVLQKLIYFNTNAIRDMG